MAEQNGHVDPCPNLSGQIVRISDFSIDGGGFSDVYKGEWTDKNGKKTIVALKLLRGAHLQDKVEATKRRLNRETGVWGKLAHPNVLRFIGICNDVGPSTAQVSIFCEFGDVMKYLTTNPNTDRLKIVVGAARGLEYLHNNDPEVVHGDFKFENILIDNDGTPKLCDFGRSRIIGHRGFTTALVAGTARYTAPEILDSEDPDAKSDGSDSENDEPETKVLTKEADVYAFGMTGLHILSGKKPFCTVKADTKVMKRVVRGDRPEGTKYESAFLTPTIWPILKHCWAHDPQERPSIKLVATQLDAV